MRLKDKTVIITGAGRGIGRTLALALAREGAHIGVCDVDEVGAEETAAQVAAEGGNSLSLVADVTRLADMELMAQRVLEARGRIDVLINNAGIFPLHLFPQMSQEDWEKVIAVNLTGTFCATRAVVPSMQRQRYGKIINMASAAGRVGAPGFTHYSAAKAGVIGLTKALARELGGFNITVNAIAPGIIRTRRTQDTFAPYALKNYQASVPLGRLGEKDDLVGITLLLASDAANYITGQTFGVDGGYVT